MSEGKGDRSTAPRQGTRASRARQTQDRNITPPVVKRTVPAKPKKGMRAVEAALAQVADVPETMVVPRAAALPDDPVEVRDPWWTPEREQVFTMALQGLPQWQVAQETGRDRHTIARWFEDERFEQRLFDENTSRFKSTRQRRTMQTVRLTDKAMKLADKMLDAADADPKDLGSRSAARDWLSEFREQSRREDEIYGLNRQQLDVNVTGTVSHKHKAAGNLSFRDFLSGSMKRLGVDVDAEEIDSARADEALVALTEKSLMEGTFLDELVEREKAEKLALQAAGGRGR